tara:strand:- start:373 stop:594 length:222 start_codon:yes stop_codon:yes gene_type:complete
MKKLASRRAIIYAGSGDDIGLVIRYLRLKKLLSSHGEVLRHGNGYAVQVKSKKAKKELSDIVKSKFGIFIKVI